MNSGDVHDLDQIIQKSVLDEIDQVIRKSKVTVLPGRFAMLRTEDDGNIPECFLVVKDGNEITLVVDESQLQQIKYSKSQKWFNIVQLAVAIPFFAVGFLAKVTASIAEKGINVLVVSSYSYDYLLIREDDLGSVMNALISIGFPLGNHSE